MRLVFSKNTLTIWTRFVLVVKSSFWNVAQLGGLFLCPGEESKELDLFATNDSTVVSHHCHFLLFKISDEIFSFAFNDAGVDDHRVNPLGFGLLPALVKPASPLSSLLRPCAAGQPVGEGEERNLRALSWSETSSIWPICCYCLANFLIKNVRAKIQIVQNAQPFIVKVKLLKIRSLILLVISNPLNLNCDTWSRIEE